MNIYGGTSSAVRFFQQLRGSDFSGGDGDSNRTVTLSNTPLTSGTAMLYIQGRILHKTQEYTLSGTTLTILGPLYNDDYLDVWY